MGATLSSLRRRSSETPMSTTCPSSGQPWLHVTPLESLLTLQTKCGCGLDNLHMPLGLFEVSHHTGMKRWISDSTVRPHLVNSVYKNAGLHLTTLSWAGGLRGSQKQAHHPWIYSMGLSAVPNVFIRLLRSTGVWHGAEEGIWSGFNY